jgi:ABC-type sugar transport system ATPase subunit
MTFLKVAGVYKQLENNFGLGEIQFTQQKLRKIAIAGETGSGKSTLLKIIAGLVQPDRGEVWFENKEVHGPVEKLVPGHPGISYLSQHFELPKFLRVEQVLSYANTLSEIDANTLYEVCRIHHLVTRKTDQLSGGEKQRIAMARLLISSPRLLLLDEPFSHLDLPHKNTLKSVINDIGEKLKITCMLVSHDPADTLTWADKIIVLRDGKVVQQGTPEKIYQAPVDEYTAGLFGPYNILTSEQEKLFPSLAKLKKKNKRFLIRPENFKIAGKDKKGVKLKSRDVTFYGGHYDVKTLLAENEITIKTSSPIKNSATIFVSVDKRKISLV